MKDRKIIFLKYSLLEELESTQRGNLDTDQVLTLVNKKKYQLEEAVVFKEKLEGSPDKNLVKEIITISEIEERGYDLYMDTVIVGETVYRVEEGFKGTLIETPSIKINHDTVKIVTSDMEEKSKTSEELLADFMLGM